MKQKIGIMLLICSFIISSFTGCGSKKDVYQAHKSGYKEMESIDGVTFDVPENALSLATAVTSISEDMDFDPANVYLYKDGKSQYLLFSMDSMVIAIQKGTRFQIKNADDKETALKNEKLMNIWFDKEGNNFEYRESEKNGYKMIGKVVAQVSVTDELYNDFVGELAVLDRDEEWSLFIGAPGNTYDDLSKKQKEMIEHVSGSLALSESNSMEPSEQQDAETAETETISEVEDASERESPNVKEDSKTEIMTEEAKEIKKEKVEKVEKVEKKENKENKENKEKEKKETIKVNNQEKIAHVTDTASESSIYNMLHIGEMGKAMALNAAGSEFTIVNITIDRLFTEEDAVSFIKSGLEESGEQYQEPPAGCTWNVIEYSIDTPIEEAYVNIKLKGLDGEKMKYRGISYSQRTFDIFSKMIKAGTRYTKLYCYYAVPNGCNEYMLECGEGTINTKEAGITSAYYKMNGKNFEQTKRGK